MTINKLHETIDAYQSGDPDVTAAAVFDALNVPTKWANLFYGVVRDECRRRSRSFVRDLETGQALNETQMQHAGSGSRASLLESAFYDGTSYVQWGEATIEQHQGRIIFQSALRDGINADIARHFDAVKAIQSTPGATCLNDVTDLNEAA